MRLTSLAAYGPSAGVHVHFAWKDAALAKKMPPQALVCLLISSPVTLLAAYGEE
jgi:hypothetical protein